MWDRCNGTITAVGLTSRQGGANAYGSEVAVDTTLLQIKKVSLDEICEQYRNDQAVPNPDL